MERSQAMGAVLEYRASEVICDGPLRYGRREECPSCGGYSRWTRTDWLYRDIDTAGGREQTGYTEISIQQVDENYRDIDTAGGREQTGYTEILIQQVDENRLAIQRYRYSRWTRTDWLYRDIDTAGGREQTGYTEISIQQVDENRLAIQRY